MSCPVRTFTSAVNPVIAAQLTLPSRAEHRRPLPSGTYGPAVRAWLTKALEGRDPWSHQTLALEKLAAGRNVVVATGTASGKSLIFQTAGMHTLLEGNGRVLAIYPQKALGADQRERWEQVVAVAGLDPTVVGEIHGDIAPSERLEIIQRARVILATPDVLHSWLLRHLASAPVQELLLSIDLVIIDEAHVYEGVFGSNSAYLFRRLHVARRTLQAKRKLALIDPQIIAATATVSRAWVHLADLTGREFEEVPANDDGSERSERTILHVEGAGHGAAAEAHVAEMLAKLASEMGSSAFIAFFDSRQGVERIARLIDRDDVLPYRSGYEAHDRTLIEKALREGRLRGVVSTSALELGIDIPHFTIGLNLGIPSSKKAFRQRLGRIGRAAPGLFAVIAPGDAFAEFGSSLEEFATGEAEPSFLYLENSYIQFAQARCLIDEMEAIGGDQTLPEPELWPASFLTVHGYAGPGAPRPRIFDAIAELGADRPHLNYPLRQIGGREFALKASNDVGDARLGTIQLHQALREAYPGATYLHMRATKRVTTWKSTSYESTIRLQPASKAVRTTPILQKTVSVSTAAADVLEGRLVAKDQSFLAEVRLQVTESVEGYCIGNKRFYYGELRKTNPNMTRKQRDFSTTGVVLRIAEPWFAGSSTTAVATRRAIAKGLHLLLTRDRNLASADVDFADSNIAIMTRDGPRKCDDAIVIYDSVEGGLRLTEALFASFEQFVSRLRRAALAVADEPPVASATVERLAEWYEAMAPCDVPPEPTIALDQNELVIFAPESEVGVRIRGELQSRTIIEPQMVSVHGTEMLMYRYQAEPGSQGWIAHDQVEPVGLNWRRAIWNPASNTMRELAA